MTHTRLLEPSTALVAYAEAIVDGGRVLVIGDALSRIPTQLLNRGARFVYVCDVDPARVAAAASANSAREVTFAPLSDGSLALREGAFDVAIVENLGAVGDIVGVLKGVQRALGPKGVALIASPNPEVTLHLLGRHDPSAIALDYYSLYDAVAAQFRVVRMLGQTPFVGYAVVDFAPNEDPLPSIDTGFVPGGAEDPEWFIAVGGGHAVNLDAFTVVQVGFKEVWKTLTERERPKPAVGTEVRPHRLPARTVPRAEPRAATLELQALERELAKRDAWIRELENRAGVADARADETQGVLDEFHEKIDAERAMASAALEQAQERQRLAEQRVQDLERQQLANTTALKSEIAALSADRAELTEELTALRARSATLEAEANRLQAEATSFKAEATTLQAETRALKAEAGAQALQAKKQAASLEATVDQKAEFRTLEAQLQERGRVIQKLEHDLRMAERIGRELISELGEQRLDSGSPGAAANASAPNVEADLRGMLDALAATNALREADLAAAEWRVQDLENRLALELRWHRRLPRG